VVWYHNFASDAEVDQFRANGHTLDPSDTTLPGRCIRNTFDGITGGGCLEMIYPTSDNSGAPSWNRPLAPLDAASTGRGAADPAANGTISLRSWDSSVSSTESNFLEGYYAHPDEVGADGHAAAKFDGSEFWVQCRMKISSSRYLPGQPDFGIAGSKALWVATTTESTPNQEIVHVHTQDGVAQWYTNFGVTWFDSPGENRQTGDYPACVSQTAAGCWTYTGDEWVTWLFHVNPGNNGVNNTVFEAYVARAGQSNYETIFDNEYPQTVSFNAGNTHPDGWNCFIPTNYTNGAAASAEFNYRYDEIIFSKGNRPIQCPLTSKTALQQAADDLAAGSSVNFTENPFQHHQDIQWSDGCIYYDPLHREIQYMGKAASGQSHDFQHYVYDEVSDAWSRPNFPAWTAGSPSGHVWNHAFDFITGRYYTALKYQSNDVRYYDRDTQSWISTAAGSAGTFFTVNGGVGADIFGWHPNLYGPGKPGLFVLSHDTAGAWNPRTDTWSEIGIFPGAPYRDRTGGMAVYMANSDRLVIFSNGTPIWIEAGAGSSSDIVTDGLISLSGGTMPVSINGKKGDGHAMMHPTDYTKMIIVDGSSTNWYESSDDGANWSLGSGGHGFYPMPNATDNEFIATSIPEYGVCIGVSSNFTTAGTVKLWKPS
jgi:hypothetical protein